jgi:hypothetical protein
MKDLLIICAALIVVTCGVVRAQDTTTAAPVKIAKKEGVKVIKGVVVSADTVSISSGSIIVKSWQAMDTLIVNESTSITADIKEAVRLADLKADDGVTAYYKLKNGNKTALRIIKNVLTPATPIPADTAGSR